MSSTLDNVAYSTVTEVPAGSRAILDCQSNDFDHNFKFWILGSNKVVGPGNDYDERKYKYKVLSGKLHIDVSILLHVMQYTVQFKLVSKQFICLSESYLCGKLHYFTQREVLVNHLLPVFCMAH